MKKAIFIAITLVISASIIFAFVWFYPKTININAQGLKLRLGISNVGNEQTVNVNINGKLHRDIEANRIFKGIINIEGEEIPVPLNQRELEIHISDERYGAGDILYSYVEKIKPGLYSYGLIIPKEDFSELSILVFDKNSDGSGSWSAQDGVLIAVPASTRAEAMEISNDLLKDYLEVISVEKLE